MLADFVKKKYVPIEESYQVIVEYQNDEIERQNSLKKFSSSQAFKERELNESLGILSKRQGDNQKAIDLYIQVLIDLSQSEVVMALYTSNGELAFEDSAACNGNQHILKFDALV